MNKYPSNSGHLLVLLRRAISDIEELHEAEKSNSFADIGKAESMRKKTLSPHEFNSRMNMGSTAGAGIPKICTVISCHIGMGIQI
jgi:ATP adenylyltransferase